MSFNRKILFKCKYELMPGQPNVNDSGFDLCADTSQYENGQYILEPRKSCLIGTSLFLELPDDIEAQIRPRSSLVINHGLMIPNSPGTIDSGYRGEIKVILLNMTDTPFVIQYGMRIAQIVFQRKYKFDFTRVDTINTNTERGTRGFGSSGLGGPSEPYEEGSIWYEIDPTYPQY